VFYKKSKKKYELFKYAQVIVTADGDDIRFSSLS